jgi:hypothetical protein
MNSRIGCVLIAAAALCAVGRTASAQTPDPTQSYFVPEAGPVAPGGVPLTGAEAVRFFRACPNNDGGSSLPNNARIKVVLLNDVGAPLAGIPAANIYILLNGGTDVQGFGGGGGADSIIANGTYNTTPLCPNLTYITADAPSDLAGVAYITFGGGDPAAPGTALRNSGRKWGHYDTELPVIANGIKILGQFVAGAGFIGDYLLQIKNVDVKGGLANGNNQGEVVSAVDFNAVKGGIGTTDALSYWLDFNSNGAVDQIDLNIATFHKDHDCGAPMNP